MTYRGKLMGNFCFKHRKIANSRIGKGGKLMGNFCFKHHGEVQHIASRGGKLMGNFCFKHLEPRNKLYLIALQRFQTAK